MPNLWAKGVAALTGKDGEETEGGTAAAVSQEGVDETVEFGEEELVDDDDDLDFSRFRI